MKGVPCPLAPSAGVHVPGHLVVALADIIQVLFEHGKGLQREPHENLRDGHGGQEGVLAAVVGGGKRLELQPGKAGGCGRLSGGGEGGGGWREEGWKVGGM